MAETFRVRIEMRQIGMRQEAGRLGGIGSCGRELCCSTWLTNFKTVSTAAARYQNLSLNTLKLAGQCGKLKCCLNYELDTYLDALKDIPDRIENLQTEVGVARHQKTDIFKKLMWFSYPNMEDWIPLKVDRVKEIMAMNKKGQKPNNLKEEAVELENTAPVEKTHDYENVVGQDSLTRLDEKPRNKNNNNNRNNRNPNNRNQAGARPERAERTDRPARNDRPERTERTPRPERTDRPERKDRQERPPKAVQQRHSNDPAKKVDGGGASEGNKPEGTAAAGQPGTGNRNNRNRNNRRKKPAPDKPNNE
jgi:hypothetical protein